MKHASVLLVPLGCVLTVLNIRESEAGTAFRTSLRSQPLVVESVSGFAVTQEGRNASLATSVQGWPRHAQVRDNSLQYTFRGNDWLSGKSHWLSKPRVNGCKGKDLSKKAAHACDLMGLEFWTVAHGGSSKRYFGRDYVFPLDSPDKVQQLANVRNGPLQAALQQKDGRPVRRVTFVVHGYVNWGSDSPGIWQGNIARKLVQGGGGEDLAVVVEWPRGAHATWEDCHGFECMDDYSVAMADTRVVGKYVQRLAAWFREVLGEDIHFGCIGHSVGSHACGFAGKYMGLEELDSGPLRMSRISALDPAGPSHSLVSNVHHMLGGRSFIDPAYKLCRLNKKDADYVDVYISDPGGFGYDVTMAVANEGRREVLESDMLGHVTFLLNGEHYALHEDMQPGCESEWAKKGCSHHVAMEPYLDSLDERIRHLSPARTTALLQAQISYDPTPLVVLVALFVGAIACSCFLASHFSDMSSEKRGVWILAIAACFALAVAYLYYRPLPSEYHEHPVLAPLVDMLPKWALEPNTADYCAGGRVAKVAAMCRVPFAVGEGESGSVCPVIEDRNVTFGICAGPYAPEGMFIAPVASKW